MSTQGDYYLKLPDPARCGGLRWSHGCDAVENGDGRTVVLFQELGQILAGVVSNSAVPPFLSVLRVLNHTRCETPHAVQFTSLREATQRCKGEPVLARHLGRFVAELLTGIERPAATPTADEVELALDRLWSDGERRQPEYALLPELNDAEFAQRVGRRLAAISPSAIDHWLKFGTAPTVAGERAAEELDELPVRVAAAMELARTRPRLVGATVVAPVLEAALALPPRGRTPDPLPQGGYADVTTRGDPDRLLLSQFALDPDDFVRRFAERELLYFKREEPHAAVPPERVVVLDQGVRTWGGVRLALAAAAATLLRHPAKNGTTPRLFVSSRAVELPLGTMKPVDLATALEASDTTPHPAGCLRSALSGGAGPRDVVLLTHPRAAAEPVVAAVARDARPSDRLFVLAVADDGGCQLTEWTSRGPVPVRSFRVDLAAAEAAKPFATVAVLPAGPGFEYRRWTGDVGPEFFPFRSGLVEPPTVFGFDAGGEWLVAVGASGVPHLMPADGGAMEVLPRANFDGERLRTVTAVLPVVGGVVLCGTAAVAGCGVTTVSVISNPVAVGGATDVALPYHVAAHYDIRSRTVRAYVVGPATGPAEWDSYLGLNCVVLRAGAMGGPLAVDLAHMNRLRPTELTLKAEEAIRSPRHSAAAPYSLPVRTDLRSTNLDERYMLLRDNSFALSHLGKAEWPLFEPREDGKPLLGGALIRRVEFAGGVLALHIEKGIRHELRLFRGPDMTALGVIRLDGRRRLFRLSPDGKRVVWTRGKSDLAVAATDNSAGVVATAALAGLHGRGDVFIWQDSSGLTLSVGSHRHTFKADGNNFSHDHKLRAKSERVPGEGRAVSQCLRSSDGRFGEVVLKDGGGTVVAMLLVRREQAAGWTPAGGFWGHPSLIGGASTPGADKRLATALGLEGKPA